jgi:hypothetical protein
VNPANSKCDWCCASPAPVIGLAGLFCSESCAEKGDADRKQTHLDLADSMSLSLQAMTEKIMGVIGIPTEMLERSMVRHKNGFTAEFLASLPIPKVRANTELFTGGCRPQASPLLSMQYDLLKLMEEKAEGKQSDSKD